VKALLALTLAVAITASAHGELRAQLEPTAPGGSLIKRKPATMDPKRQGVLMKSFSRCAYGRKTDEMLKLLRHSDPVAIDHAKAETDKLSTGPDSLIADCLSRSFDTETLYMQVNFTHDRLRVQMMEEDYLTRATAVPTVDPAFPPARAYVATGDDLLRAQAITRFSDCVVARDVAGADALVRTMPGSDDERSAARALAPALGACLLAGEQMKLNAASVRTYAVEGLWARFANGATEASGEKSL
jgi:hypothetical protein